MAATVILNKLEARLWRGGSYKPLAGRVGVAPFADGPAGSVARAALRTRGFEHAPRPGERLDGRALRGRALGLLLAYLGLPRAF